MSDRGSIDNWRRDRNNAPDTYSEDVSSREFRDRPRAAPPRRSDDYPPEPRDRRKSILVDPNERAQRPRGARRNSQVRLQSSDDENGGYVPVRRPPIGSEASRVERDMASRHDAERKDGPAHRDFREKRDGYESDEGETLRRKGIPPEPRGPPPGRDGPPRGGDPRQRPQGRGGGAPRDVDPRDMEPRDMPIRTRAPPVQYGNAPVDPRRDRNDYLDDGPDPRMRRSASQRDPRARPPPQRGYDDDYDDYRPLPRRQASQRDPRGDPRRRPRDDYDDYDRGYRTDRDGGRRPPPRYDDYYSDGGHARGRNRPPQYDDDRRGRRDSYGGGYGRGGRDGRDGRDGSRGRRDRYRDEYDEYKDRGGRKSKADWQATAATAFATYAMPMIKKEGTKFLRKQMQEFMSKQGGR